MNITVKGDNAIIKSGGDVREAPHFRSAVPPEMLALEKTVAGSTPFAMEMQGAMLAFAQGRYDDAKRGFATVGGSIGNSNPALSKQLYDLAQSSATKAKTDGNTIKRAEFQADPAWLAELDRLADTGARTGDMRLQSGALFQKFIWTGDTSFRTASENVFAAAMRKREEKVDASGVVVDRGVQAIEQQGGPRKTFVAGEGGTNVSGGGGVLGFRLKKGFDASDG
jgi:hypothetical protein